MFKEPIREAEHMRGSGTVGAPVAHCRALCWGPGCVMMTGAVVVTVCVSRP